MILYKYKTRLYKIWAAMRGRCNNNNSKKAHLWATKGIKVCIEWDNFENFKLWAYQNGYIEQNPDYSSKMDCLSLDRIDSDRNYSPDNCRWISLRENSKNVLQSRKDKLEILLQENMRILCMVGNDVY